MKKLNENELRKITGAGDARNGFSDVSDARPSDHIDSAPMKDGAGETDRTLSDVSDKRLSDVSDKLSNIG